MKAKSWENFVVLSEISENMSNLRPLKIQNNTLEHQEKMLCHEKDLSFV